MNAKQQIRIHLVLAGVVLVCSVSLMALVYLIINEPVVDIKPSVAVSPPSPVAVPVMNNQNLLLSNRTIPLHASYHSGIPHRWQEKSSSSPAFRIYTTSSAPVYSAGGGNGSAFVLATISHAPQRGIQQPSAPVTTFVAVASTRQLSAPEAEEAPQMAHLVSRDPRHAPGPPNTGDEGLPGEHQLVEHPIGDGVWVMVLLAMLYLFAGRVMEKVKQIRCGEAADLFCQKR